LICFKPVSDDADLSSASLEQAYCCRDFLSAQGWPEPVIAANEHSAHLVYPLDLPNNAQSTELVHQVLSRLAERFNDTRVSIKLDAADPAFLCPVYGSGTVTNLNATSSILSVPAQPQQVAQSLLESWEQWPTPARQVASKSSLLFVEHCCSLNHAAWTPTGALHSAYQLFCQQQGWLPVIDAHFARQLLFDLGLESKRRKVNGTVIRGIQGIQLHNDR
jgi:hypothetical protein